MSFGSVVGTILDLKGELGKQCNNSDKTAYFNCTAAIVLVELCSPVLRILEKHVFGKTEGTTWVT